MTYYSPTSAESVDMDEALKAGHVEEPAREMHFWAMVKEVEDAKIVKSIDFRMIDPLLDPMA